MVSRCLFFAFSQHLFAHVDAISHATFEVTLGRAKVAAGGRAANERKGGETKTKTNKI